MVEVNLKTQLQRDEGFRNFPYRDTENFLTIGFGRNLDTDGISRIEAEFLLDNDIAKCMADVDEALPWVKRLEEPRQAVFYNMRYNLGMGGLLGFRKMLAAAQRGEWATASMEMLDSKWYAQVGPRAARLARQLESGEWV